MVPWVTWVTARPEPALPSRPASPRSSCLWSPSACSRSPCSSPTRFFHLLAEVFFTIIAVSVFLMAWMLREFLDDDLPVFLGIVLFAVAVLHVVHVADYPGVGIITNSPDPPTQVWVGLTLLQSASFLAAPLVLGRRIRMLPVLAAYLVVDGLILASVYWWKIFPVTLTAQRADALQDGQRVRGLRHARRRRAVVLAAGEAGCSDGAVAFLISALVSGIVAELWFTAYRTPHTWPNALGYAFLVLSALLIYRAVVEESLARPHALAVAGLRLERRGGARRAAGGGGRAQGARPAAGHDADVLPGEELRGERGRRVHRRARDVRRRRRHPPCRRGERPGGDRHLARRCRRSRRPRASPWPTTRIWRR